MKKKKEDNEQRCRPEAIFYDWGRGDVICMDTGEVLDERLPLDFFDVNGLPTTSHELERVKLRLKKDGVMHKGRKLGVPLKVREEIIRLRKEGWGMEKIADKCGVSVSTVWRVLKGAGLSGKRKKNKVTEELVRKVLSLRRKGYSTPRIANETGLAVATVWRIIKRHEKKRRKRRKRKARISA